MAKQLNVKLNFQADTSQVQQALASLTTSLSNISNITPTVGNKLTQDLSIAKKSAQDLQMHLNNAFNVKTGNLDLGKLDASLKSSGQSLGQLSSNLLKAGTQGEQAFLNIQRAIGNASIQINQANGALASFLTTLKNTARWQISSSILHGFMGALQSAWGYAKDLDKSLNNIRIVTGYSSDRMADFAEQANKAAKALSTTTTKYTDASLIFYQQGLSDEEVQKRTEVTIKMANAAGQSAQVVSDQLTAVWNNFYDGTKSLEYYADVMTALGAATASSTDEIAGGLEKFAAIGETIGLSYEYAAAALATITSNTRQTEDVVGTALKTIFARIQGLKLGETLDDGVTLNKYSEALQSVGISIFEQNGELKKMDDILDEMGSKWNTLSKAQQTALAQTVAGTRQYTQLVALMKDWDSGDNDSMMANLETAYNSEGALQEQADIYADSWEAAVDRVKASAEGIYRDLFPTEELTGLMDGFATLLEGIDGLVRGFGGLQGILLLVSSIALNSFRNQIGGAIDELISKVSGGLTNAFSNLSSTFQSGGILAGLKQMVGYNGNIINQTQTLSAEMRQASDSTQTMSEKMALTEANMEKGVSQALKMSMEMTKSAQEAQTMDASFGEYNSNLMSINNIQAVIERSTKYLTKEQQEQLVILQEQAQAANEQLLTAKQLANEAERKKNALLEAPGDQGTDIDRYVSGTPKTPEDGSKIAYTSDLMNTKPIQDIVQAGLDMYNTTREVGNAWEENSIVLDTYKNHLALAFDNTVDLNAINKEAKATFAGLVDAGADVEEAIKNCSEGSDDMGAALDGALKKMSGTNMGKKIASDIREAANQAGGLAKNSTLVKEKIAAATKDMHTFGVATGSSEKNMLNIKNSVLDTRTATQGVSTAAENLNNKFAQITNTLQNALNGAMSFGKIFTDLASSFSSVAMGINAISNAIDTINDEDASFTSKLTAGAMAATMGIRGLTSAMGVLNTFIKSATTYTNLKNAADLAQTAVNKNLTKEERKSASVKLQNLLVTKLGVKEDQKSVVMKGIMTAAQKGETGATLKDTIANWANVASQAAKYWYIALIIAAVAALAAGIYFLVTAEDAETKALKAATEALEKSTEAHKEAQQAVEDFQSSLSDYEDGIKGLQDIAKESNNLKEAVEDVNKKAKELIETYGLFGDFHYGEFGEIIIDEEALKNAEKQLLTYEKIAASIRYTNELRYQQAQTDKKFKDTAEDMKYTVAYEYTEDQYGQRNNVSYLENPDNYEIRNYNRFAKNEDGTTKKGIDKQEISLLSGDLKILNQAFDDTKEALGGIPPNADQLIEAIKNNETAYGGLSDTVKYDLENVITDNIITLTDFNSGIEKATEASLYFAKEILGMYTDDEYAEGISKAAGGDSTLEELMTSAKNTILAGTTNEDGVSLDEQIKSQEEDLVTTVLNNASDYDVADVTEKNIRTFIESTLGLEEGTGGTWLKENYSEIFGDGAIYSDDITAQDMGKLALEAQGFQVTSTKDESGRTVYSYLDKEGKSHSTTYDNKDAQEAWATLIGNYAIGESTSQVATEQIDPQKFEEVMTKIVQNGDQMGADWSTALISGIASGDFDFSSLFGDLSQSEKNSFDEMDGVQIAEMFGLTTNDLTTLGFEDADAFATAFKEGLAEYDAEDAKNALDTEYANKAEGLGIDKDELESYKELLQTNKDIAEAYEDNYEGLNEVALANKRMEKGVKKLADGWKDFDDIMSDSTSTAEDISSIMPEINEGLQDVLNLSDEEFELLPPDFAQKNWGLIQDVMNGVEGSVDELRNKAGEEILLNLGAKVDADGDGSVDAAFMEIHNKIAEYDNMEDFTVGVAIDPAKHAEFIASCNELINAAGMTADQAQAYFASMGYDVELEEVEAPPKETPWHIENPVLDEAKTKEAGVPIFTGTETLTGTNTSGGGKALAVKTITPNGSFGGGVGVNTTAPKSATSGAGKGGGGGGGSEPKKNKKTRKDEVVERYKEVNDQIDDAQRKMKQAEKAAEGLWGPNRLKEMKKVREALKEELKLLKQKAAENAQYLEEDRAYLQEVAAKNGAQAFTFDANGNISNYDEVMGALYAELAAAENAAGDTVDENEQKIIDAIKERIEEVEGAIGIYDTTKEELEDSEDAIKEWVLQIQDAYLNELNYEFEIKAVVDDSELAKLDYYLGKMDGGSIWDMYEAGALMIGTGKHQGAGQMQVYEGQLEDYEARYNKLLTAYTTIDPETGERQINQEQFIKELSTLQTEIYGTLNNLNAMDESMKHYYGDTLAAASEELSKYTDLMDNHTAVLEHYGNLINLLGKSKDFDKMSHVLKAQVEVSKNAAEVSRANYEMLRAEADDKRKAWEAAQKDSSLSEYEKSVIEQQWIDAETAAGEAQDQMLSDAEAWAEALVAQLENDLAGLADTLETNLAGDFGSLSNLTESLERANSLQEEYLTTTNKIYETNKLMNQAQQEIDKTSNAVSKRRLKQFITETEQLQNKNKLSQFELDIRQAEYEILLAELALEEAQSAKSTVRLQRDSEGNFGYVYTADTSEVDKAQQNLEDAQNALYNISLEGANKYTESYIQTIQEMNDKITELTTAWQNGEIESKKEYDARMLELQEYYGEKLAQYSNLQQIALTTDSRVIDDAWSKDFFHMTTQTELWMSHVDTYVEGVSKAFEDYDLGMAEVEDHVSEYLGNIEESTGKIVDKNEALEKSITDPNNGLLKALGDEISKVNSLTAEYLELRKAIQGTISDSENLGDQIASDIAQESDGDESNDYQPTGTGDSESGDDNGSDNSNNDNSDDNNKKEITVGGQVRADGAYIYDAPNDDPETQVFKNDPVYTVVQEKGDWVLTRHHSLSSGNTGWFKKSDLVALDTGGYTGDWAGSYGKLALLHKKELILDQEDTINFLQSIEAMERILSTIDLQAANAQYIGNILSPTVNATKERETLEQNVHIEASFPNAVNRNEIQEAFENIVNLASQYANKK